MGRPQVSIRLGTTGRSDVERDFAAIGDSGEAQAKRYQTSWERASAEAERALEKQAKAAARMAAAAPTASGATNMINPVTGGSYAQPDGRAEASARAIAASYDQAEVSARRLLASVDPLYAAQMRYDAALQEAIGLQKIGAMTSDQLAVVQTGLKKQLDDTTALYGKQGTAVGNTRIAQMELMHVVRGSVDQFAAGAPPMQIFTMHLGMLGQAAALSGESMGKFGAFMSSGWGLALTVAVVALGPLVTKLFQSGDALDAETDKLKKDTAQQLLASEAKEAFAKTLDGVQQSLRDLTKAYEDYENRLKTTAQRELELAQATLKNAQADQAKAVAALARAKAENGLLSYATNTGGAASGLTASLGAEARQADAQHWVDQAGQAIASAQTFVDKFQSVVTAETASEDKLQQIKRHYDDLVNKAQQHAATEARAARAAGDTARATAITTTELDKQVRALREKEKAEEDAARERDRKPGKNAGGEAIFDAQIASFFDTAAKYRGLSENKASDRSVLEAFFKEANQQLDPEKTAWCAAFVNAVLAANGVKGTGSLAAKSFLTFGKDDTKSPQRGDIAVVKSGAGDHVGFVDSVDKGQRAHARRQHRQQGRRSHLFQKPGAGDQAPADAVGIRSGRRQGGEDASAPPNWPRSSSRISTAKARAAKPAISAGAGQGRRRL
jgi:uncharacterized protein (TIGR02594 family)